MENNSLKKINFNYDLEKQSNEQKIKDCNKRWIHYEQSIVLQHLISGFYITLSSENSLNTLLNKKAMLSPILEQNVQLKLIPRFRYRKKNSPVYFSDELQIRSQKKKFYLISSEYIKKKIDTRKFKFFMRRNLRDDWDNYTTRISLFSGESDFCWKFHLFKRDTTSCISGGDLVRLYHLNSKGYLQADLVHNLYEKGEEELFVKPENKGEFGSWSSIFEVNHFGREELSSAFTSVNPGFSFDKAMRNSQFFMKHFMFGRLVGIRGNELVINSRSDIAKEQQRSDYWKEGQLFPVNRGIYDSVMGELKAEADDRPVKTAAKSSKTMKVVVFQFYSVLKNVEEVWDDKAYFIRSSEGYVILKSQEVDDLWKKSVKEKSKGSSIAENNFWDFHNLNVRKDEGGFERKKNFYPIIPEFFEDVQKSMQTRVSPQTSPENTFLVQKVADSEIKEIYFVKSFRNYLILIRNKLFYKEKIRN